MNAPDLHVACAADPPFLPHAATMLHSALTRNRTRLIVHFLHRPSFPAGHLAQLKEMVESHGSAVVFHEIGDEQLVDLPVSAGPGPEIWYRGLLPELLPDLARIVYLDADALVLDRLDPLLQLPLSNCYLAAVKNLFMRDHRHRLTALGLEAHEYFNTGVLVLNLNVMREVGFSRAFVKIARETPPGLWPEQDALNLTARSHWLPIPPRWNAMNCFALYPDAAAEVFGWPATREAIIDPAVRHFEGPGPNKPWHRLHARAGQSLYRHHRMATPWPDFRLDGDTVWNRTRWVIADARRQGRRASKRLAGRR